MPTMLQPHDELKAVDEQRSTGNRNGSANSDERDAEMLARFGKGQVLKRNFGFLSMFGFSCTILITWEALLALAGETFSNGGPAGIIYGFILSWVGTLSVYLVISELSSMAPIACGQYFWVNILAPSSSRRFLSYSTGWLTLIAWISTLATGIFFQGTMIQGLVILNYPDSYQPQPVHGMLLSWAVVAVAVFINTVISSLLPKIEGTILIFHILGFFAIIVPLIYLSDHASASNVFSVFVNEGNWSSQGLSFCIGMTAMVELFAGSDAVVHMAEEIENPALNVPRAILTTTLLNGTLGLGMALALLFAAGDIESALETPTGYPYMQIFVQATKSVGGATVMAAIVIGLSICASIGFLATASRMTWAFARDNGLPFSKIFRKIDPQTSIPVASVLLVAVIPVLLTLINLGSSTVFNDVISLSVNGFYLSYLVPSALLLYRRATGAIKPAGSYDSQDRVISRIPVATSSSSKEVLVDFPLVWGPWKVPGVLGIINNAFACTWMIFVIFWGFWPPEYPATAENMNYAVLVTGATIIFSLIYYFTYGHKIYKGPLVEVS